MELAGGYSIYSSLYKRSDSLMSRCDVSRRVLVVEAPARSAPLATLLEAYPPDSKIAPHDLFKASPTHLPAPLAPQFFGFFAVFHPFLKNFFAQPLCLRPPCAESPPRAHAQAKTPEFRGKTARPCLAATPKTPAKHPSGTLKNPPLTPLHIKKLSKVRSTLLTAPPRECILEYMRLKEPRRPPHTGRLA